MSEAAKTGARIGAIVLAAGASRRMGANKMLLPIDGKPMLLGIVESLVDSQTSISPIVVVTGHDPAAVEALLARVCPSVELTNNADFDTGKMLSSIKVGLLGARDRCDACVIVLGDQPQVRFETIDLLAQNFSESVDVVRPVFRGKHAHPILLSMKNVDAILSLPLTATLNDFVSRASRVIDVVVDDPATIHDIDTPADYDAINQRDRR